MVVIKRLLMRTTSGESLRMTICSAGPRAHHALESTPGHTRKHGLMVQSRAPLTKIFGSVPDSSTP